MRGLVTFFKSVGNPKTLNNFTKFFKGGSPKGNWKAMSAWLSKYKGVVIATGVSSTVSTSISWALTRLYNSQPAGVNLTQSQMEEYSYAGISPSGVSGDEFLEKAFSHIRKGFYKARYGENSAAQSHTSKGILYLALALKYHPDAETGAVAQHVARYIPVVSKYGLVPTNFDSPLFVNQVLQFERSALIDADKDLGTITELATLTGDLIQL
jgi:hypothetical protein